MSAISATTSVVRSRRAAVPRVPTALPNAAAEIAARRGEGGSGAEQQHRHERGTDREREHARIESQRCARGQRARQQARQVAEAGRRDHEADDDADGREQHAFGQQLPQHAAARGTERFANRELLLPRRRLARASGSRRWRRRSAARAPRRRAARAASGRTYRRRGPAPRASVRAAADRRGETAGRALGSSAAEMAVISARAASIETPARSLADEIPEVRRCACASTSGANTVGNEHVDLTARKTKIPRHDTDDHMGGAI